jgi:small-conductance mechanosensitive channel
MRSEVNDIVEIVDENPWAAWGALVIAAGIVLVVAFVASWVFRAVTSRLGHRAEVFTELSSRFPRPIFCLLTVTGWRGAVAAFFPRDLTAARGVASYALTLGIIAVTGWILGKVLIFLLDGAMRKQDASRSDQFTMRRRRTQLRMIRSLVIAVVVVLTAAAMLLTIPGARAFGASLFASAGLVSIVAGLAAQSTLGNLIAGFQLAFSNRLRVGDTVEVNGQQGVVEEITLTYVVVHIWDDRRHVLPSTYFTTTPYTNQTRNQTQLAGTVLIDVDPAINVPAVRAELERILDSSPEWDRRSWGLAVVDAIGGVARLQASMTAADGDALGALRTHVREELLAFIATERPDELPRTRAITPGA